MALRLSTEKTVVGFKGVFPWISSHMTALTMAIILPVAGVLSSAPDWEPAEKGNSRHKPSTKGSNARIRYFIVFSLIIWGPARMIEIARKLGKLVHTLRKVTSDLTATVTDEMYGEKDNLPRQQSNSTNDARQVKTPQK